MQAGEGARSAPLIELRDVFKRYAQGDLVVEVLHGVSLSIQEGEFVAIMGASGSGKTTLMNIIGCMDRPSAGNYRLMGRDIAELDGDALAELRLNTFGFIFQRYNLLGNASALENVQVPAIYAGMPAGPRREHARALLTRLGLGERLDYSPGQLSGGQQQRVSIARALMNGGRVILADEPTGALDSRSGKEVMTLLHQLHGEGHTVVVITHDPNIAKEAERVVHIRDGHIVEDTGPSEQAVRRLEAAAPRLDRHAETARTVLMLDIMASVRTALRALKASPVRTFLTLLGVMIGVGSVVAMLAFGNGARQQVLDQIQALGTNLLIVKPGAPGVRGAGATTTLLPADADAIARLPNVGYVVPQAANPVTVRYGNVTYTTTLYATTPDFVAANNWPVARGTFISQANLQGFAPVAVLGQTTAKALSGAADPVGRYVLINNTPLRVIGLLSAKGADQQGNDRDDGVFVPLTTGQARITGQTYLKFITVEITDTQQMDATQTAINTLLLRRHHTVDFQVRSMTALLQQQAQTQQTLTLMLGAVALISLLVGGIGVMNIMLVSVTERTREIGGMAVGARAFHILLQFVTEALVVCTVGSLIGVAGGLLVAGVAALGGAAILITLPPLLFSFASALATGLVFGYLPAKRAAGLDPVVALSTE